MNDQPAEPEPYSPTQDLAGSIELAYKTIRERKEKGGPGWKPKEAAE